MARLSDLIKRGKLPEKEKKEDVKIRDIANLRETQEEALEALPEETPVSNEMLDFELPTEKTGSETVEAENISVESISLPSEEDITLSDEELNEQARIEGLYKHAQEYLEGVLSNLKKKQKFCIEKGLEIVSEIVNTEKAVETLYGQAVQSTDVDDSLATHSVNVCLYALMLGIGVDYSKEQLTELGITALLHDIGMILMPDEILHKIGKLSETDLKTIKKHPYYTYKILQTIGGKNSWIADIAYQEQERENGQGYPRGLKGEEIHDYAKIIGVVDVYEALTHQRPQRKKFMPHEAVKLIISTQKDLFSNEVKKLLLTRLSCFPQGSFVKLNSKAIGKVTEINGSSPLRPTIQIMYDSRGKKLPKKKIIKLIDAPLLYIIETIAEADLPDKIPST